MIRTIQKDGQILDMEEGNEELQKGLMEIVKQKDNEALKKFEEEEFE